MVDQHIGWLDVTVDDALLVGRLQRLGEVKYHSQRRFERQARAADEPVQRLALHILHHQVRPVAIKATIENRHDVGMGKTGRRPGFALKPLERVWIGMARGGEHLDGHRAVKGQVATAVNHPESPAAQPVDDLILANVPRQYGECACVLPGASPHRVVLGGHWVHYFEPSGVAIKEQYGRVPWFPATRRTDSLEELPPDTMLDQHQLALNLPTQGTSSQTEFHRDSRIGPLVEWALSTRSSRRAMPSLRLPRRFRTRWCWPGTLHGWP